MANPTPQDYVEARKRCLHREIKYIDQEQYYSFHPENCGGCEMIAYAFAEQREPYEQLVAVVESAHARLQSEIVPGSHPWAREVEAIIDGIGPALAAIRPERDEV